MGISVFFLPDYRDSADKRQPQNKELTEKQWSTNERMQSAESWDILAFRLQTQRALEVPQGSWCTLLQCDDTIVVSHSDFLTKNYIEFEPLYLTIIAMQDEPLLTRVFLKWTTDKTQLHANDHSSKVMECSGL